MDFCLTEEQRALRDAVRDLLAVAPADGLWARLAEMGLFAAPVPSVMGGLGLTEVDLVPVVEEVGAAAVPWPVAETMLVAAPLLAELDDPRLPALASGEVRVAVTRAGEVPFGQMADLVLVLEPGRVRLAAPESVIPVSGVDESRGLARVVLHDDAVITTDPMLVELSHDRAELATAAQLIGLGRRMLDLAVAYVGIRHQFGVPVGSFQAVKHHLANALLALDFAAPTVLAAGWALAHRAPTRRRDVSLAALLAVEAARAVARIALQCHGAIGYTVEYDLHVYAKRTWALAAGVDLDVHLDRLADALDLLPLNHGVRSSHE
jgi:alkylation response protein AidB-like acyl-CoA dehydrogenase